MVDEFNATEHPKALFDPLPPQWEILRDLPWGVPGCTGIIARNSQDGTVYHARNQDLNPVPILLDLNYIGIFEKGGKEVREKRRLRCSSCGVPAARTTLVVAQKHVLFFVVCLFFFWRVSSLT